MIIKTLVDNISVSDEFRNEHGLSLYIKTSGKNILFDTGASALFLENAKKMNVDISNIDYLILSHGHNDHGGGLETFLKANNKAEIFIHRRAFDKYYSVKADKEKYIGLDQRLKENKQIIYTTERFFINKNIEVFSNVKEKTLKPKSNANLFKEENNQKLLDDFLHEQNLIIKEAGKSVLISGCSHNGIINIIEKFKELKGFAPDYVIGGFHLHSRTLGSESFKNVDKISEYLLASETQCYTLHCTGVDAYNRMKIIMNEKVKYLKAGSQIEI